MNSFRTINFDQQASTPVDSRILSKMLPFFSHRSGNPHSSHHAIGWENSSVVRESAQSLARLIGADEDEIVFASGASEANNLALLGLGRRAAAGKRRRILVSAIEHKCVLEAGRVLAEQYGYQVEHIPVNEHGYVSGAVLSDLLDEDVLAISIMAANNEIGTIQDIEALAETARRHGVIFHCDAAQAPLAMDMMGIAQRVDLLSFSGHKMYGPQGIGALYIAHRLHDQIEPLIFGGGQQNGLRAGTVPVALCVGMGAAADLLTSVEGQVSIKGLREQRDRFVATLMDSRWQTRLNGPPLGSRHPANANICFPGFSAEEILGALQPMLAASAGSACSTGIPEPSHVLRAIGLSGEDADASIRFSLGFGVSDQDVGQAVELIDEALGRLAGALAHSA